jgi:hypothetical protein
MRYLDPDTLQSFIFLYHKENSIPLKDFSSRERNTIIEDILYNELHNFFYFKLNIYGLGYNGEIEREFWQINGMKNFCGKNSLRKINKVLRTFLKGNEGTIISTAEINECFEKNLWCSMYLTQGLYLNIYDQEREKILDFLKQYIECYKKDELTLRHEENFYDFEKSLSAVIEILIDYYNHYGRSFNIGRSVKIGTKEIILEREIRLYDIIIYLLFGDYIIINDCYFKILNQGIINGIVQSSINILNLDITMKKIPQEIIQEENEKFFEYYKKLKKPIKNYEDIDKNEEIGKYNLSEKNLKEIVYRITYTFDRRILLNKDILISHPNLLSENDLVFKYVYDNPNRQILRDEIEKEIKMKLLKNIPKIIDNLGFTRDLRRVFFSNSNEKQFYFRNPITREDLDNLGIDRIRFRK